MHCSEELDFEPCAECGAEVHSARDRSHGLDAERALCFACALRRGGAYDARDDTWTQAPDLAGPAPAAAD